MNDTRKLDSRSAEELARIEAETFQREASFLAAKLLFIALQMEAYAYQIGRGDERNLPLAGELRALRGGIDRKWLKAA